MKTLGKVLLAIMMVGLVGVQAHAVPPFVGEEARKAHKILGDAGFMNQEGTYTFVFFFCENGTCEGYDSIAGEPRTIKGTPAKNLNDILNSQFGLEEFSKAEFSTFTCYINKDNAHECDGVTK